MITMRLFGMVDGTFDRHDRPAWFGAIFTLLFPPPPEPPPPQVPAGEAISVHVEILVATNAGNVIGELEGDLQSVSWILRGVGEAPLRVPRSSRSNNEILLRGGNRVLIQFSNGLENWAGVIANSQEWDDRAISVRLVQAKRMLFRRETGWEQVFEAARAGIIFRTLLNDASAVYPHGLITGAVSDGANEYDITYNSRKLGDAFDELVRFFDADDWDVLGTYVAGVLRFSANLYAARGLARPNTALVEGPQGNVNGIRYHRDLEIVNAYHLAGEGDSWESDARAYADVLDGDSVARFGYSEESVVVEGIYDEATLEQIGHRLLQETAWPRVAIGLEVADRQPGRYAAYQLGDSVTVQLPSYGHGGTDKLLRVIGRSFRPQEGTCEIVLEGAGE